MIKPEQLRIDSRSSQIISYLRSPIHCCDTTAQKICLAMAAFTGCIGLSLLLKKHATKDGIRYEGGRRFLIGQPHGKGRCFFPNGNRYEGEFFNGVKNGKGTLVFADGNRYEGEFLNDKMNGKGTLVFANGNRYEGEFLNDKMNGKGTLVLVSEVRYEGEFLNDKITGKGKLFFPRGDRYEGEFLNTAKNGKGIYFFADGNRYEGEFLNDKITGKGIYFFTNKDRYEGEFLNSVKNGKGKLFFANENRYEGEFLNDKITGKGIYVFANGNRYEGEFLNGEMNGKGTYFFVNGKRYEGEFLNGERNGKGTIFYTEGGRYEGEFLNGERNGKGEIINSIGKRLGIIYDLDTCVGFSEEHGNGAPSTYIGQIDPTKECAVVIETSFDHNGSFSSNAERTRWINQLETLGCPTQFICPPNFQSVIKTISEGMPIKILVIRAHGCSQGMEFAKEEGLITLFKLQPLLSKLSEKSIIVLESCSTGTSQNILSESRVIHCPSLAEQISLERPDATIIAPEGEIHAGFDAIHCTANPERRTFTIEIQMLNRIVIQRIDRVFKGKEA